MVVSSWLAASLETPLATRARRLRKLRPDQTRSRSGCVWPGRPSKGSAPAVGNLKPGPVTPTMVIDVPPTVTVRPITVGSAPKRRLQRSSAMMPTAAAP
jgi:hypothetical protein